MKIFGQALLEIPASIHSPFCPVPLAFQKGWSKKFQFYLFISLLQWWRLWGKQCWHPKNCTFLQILAHYVLWHLYWQTKRKKPEQKKFTATKIKLFLLLHKITTNKKTAGKSDVQNKSIPAQFFKFMASP